MANWGGLPSIVSQIPNDLRNFLQRVKESMDGYMAGPDRFVRISELKTTNIISVDALGNVTGAGTATTNTATGGTTGSSGGTSGGTTVVIDYTPPPTPTGLVATGAITSIILTWDNPAGYTNLSHTEIWRADVDDIGLAVMVGTALGDIYTDPTGPSITHYYWIRFISQATVSGPYNNFAGVLGQTSADPAPVLTLLNGSITTSQLSTALNTSITQIGTNTTAIAAEAIARTAAIQAEADARAASVAAEAALRGAAISNEATIRQGQTDTLAQSISLLTAGVAGAFDPGVIWYFDWDAQGWSAVNGTFVWNTGWIENTPTAFGCYTLSPTGLGVAGITYTVVKARIKRLSGTTWLGTLQYSTSAHGLSATYQKTIPDPGLAIGDIAIVEWDMTQLDGAGGNDWINSTIDQIALDLTVDVGEGFAFDWVAIGRNAPGASMAGLVNEQTARTTADTALASDITTLAAQVNDATTGLPGAFSAITTEASTRAAADSTNASSISALSSTLNDPATGLAAAHSAITTEASTRAAADTANATAVSNLATTVNGQTTSIQTLQASVDGVNGMYTVKIDNNGFITGFGLTSSLIPGGTPTSAFLVNVDSFAVATPSTSIPAWAASTAYAVGKFVGIAGDATKMLVCKIAGTSGATAPSIAGAVGSMVTDGTVQWQIASRVPISVLTTTQTINGVSVAPGVYIDGATIVNGTIQNAQIANLAVDNAKIANLAVDKLTAGSLAASQYIQSSNYVTGTTGFSINADGSAEFSNITARGNIQATSFSQITLATNQHIKYGQTAFNTGTGFFLGDNGAGVPVFSIGNSAGNRMTWNGTSLTVNAAINGGSININNLFTVSSTGAVSIKSSTATNVARLEVANNVIKVIDAAGVVRVKIGDLLA